MTPPPENSRVKILLGRSWLSKKIFCREKNIESNFLGGYKNFWVKNFLVKKILGQNLFGSIDMGPIFLSKKTGRVKPRGRM